MSADAATLACASLASMVSIAALIGCTGDIGGDGAVFTAAGFGAPPDAAGEVVNAGAGIGAETEDGAGAIGNCDATRSPLRESKAKVIRPTPAKRISSGHARVQLRDDMAGCRAGFCEIETCAVARWAIGNTAL